MEQNTPIVESNAKNFEDLKNDLISLAEENDACSDAAEQLESAETIECLLKVVKDNISWCCQNIPECADKLVACFGNELLLKYNIYVSGVHNINVTEANTVIVLCGSSSATVKTWDSSSATVETWGSSSATVETWGSSSATVETWGSSSATVKTCGSSSATVETWGSSSATVETWGSSSATVKTCASSSANIGRYFSSKLEYSLGYGICPLIKHLTEKKVFIKTSEFEIVQVSQ